MTTRSLLQLLPLPLALAASGAYAQPAPAVASTPAAPASFLDALTQGKVNAYSRLRYEHVDIESVPQHADAVTVSARLGYTTASYQGFQAMIEGEGTTPLQNDYYDGTGTNTSGYPAVADPENYEINQAWLAYTYEDTTARVGRQRIVLDNARFIGDVGWRQNQQTFDAVFLQDKTFQDLTLTYGYLDRINRVFDDSLPQYDWASDSHIVNAAYKGLPFGTLTGYAYLLDFDRAHDGFGAVASSSQTYGLSFAGSSPATDTLKVLYRLEYATQSDYGSSPLDYRADYYTAELGAATKTVTLLAAYEVLGSDDGKIGSGFKTPLATLHSHNGWADKFTTTPDDGLTDLNLKATVILPADLTLLARYHWFFSDDTSAKYGREFDLQLTYKYDAHLSFTGKAAFYTADSSAAFIPLSVRQDTDKFWLQAEYTY